MPRTLFAPVSAARARNRRSLGTVCVSIALHVTALAVVAAWHITAAFHPPEVPGLVMAFVPAPTMPPPPPPPARKVPPSVPASPASVTNAAPTVAHDRIAPEPAIVPAAGVPIPSSAITVGSSDPLAIPGRPDTVTLAIERRSTVPGRLGGDIRPPQRVVYVTPVYPAFARTARIEGDVTLEATLDESGAVTNVTVRRSVPALDRAAVEAVLQWRYTPTRLNGVAVPVVMEVTVRFRLR
jgi:protein TonB